MIRGLRVLSARRWFTSASNAEQVTVTSNCAQQIAALKKGDQGLRLSVEGGGCAGFEYKFEMVKGNDDDLVIEKDGEKVFIDPSSLEFVQGSVIDYQKELIRSAFRVIANPNAEMGCGCGTSFAPKD